MPKTQEQKRKEADVRRAQHEARTPEEQLALIEQRPGASAGERERLQRQSRALTTEAILDAAGPKLGKKRGTRKKKGAEA